jgi:hypothetical protein
MRSLGNRAVGNKNTSRRILIGEPGAADELLGRALDAEDEGRRVIFFCACESRRAESCHRMTVAGLLHAAAARRRLRLETIEWPGTPAENIRFSSEELGASGLAANRRRWSITTRQASKWLSLGWGSLVTIENGEREAAFVSGPPMCNGTDQWSLPVLKVLGSPPAPREAGGVAQRYRAAHRLGSQLSTEESDGETPFAPSCVYTLAHPHLLRDAVDGKGSVTIQQPWTSARVLLEKAKKRGETFAVIFGDATDCSRLIGWAAVKSIAIDGRTTRCKFEELRRMNGSRAPQELRLVSTGKKIARGFIRPYAICGRPEFC